MSLTKLFNLKYLYENIKKSKMAIILFSIIVPAFTTLLLITGSGNNEYINFLSLGGINIAFMYIIPFIFSFCLFGYIYKKNSVDFIGSMPLSRKTIYFTNVLGGIGLIVLTQLITLILTFLAPSVIETIIFPGLIWDIFWYQSVAYIYMFSMATLAMSFSGNVRIQIVLMLLILCLIPASHLYIEAYADSNASTSVNAISYFEKINYTAPFQIFTGQYNYNPVSMIKMIALSIAYFGIGFVLFNKRKMEMAGDSFLTNKMHLIVKALTLVPFVMLLMVAVDESEFEITLIVLAIALVYWYTYDLITGKKIKFLKNLSTFALAIASIVAVYLPSILIDEAIIESLDYDDVVKIEIDEIWYDDVRRIILDDEIVIKDEKEIRSIMNIAEKGYDYYNSNYYYEDEQYDKEKYYIQNYPRLVDCTLTFKNGRKAVRTLRGNHLKEYLPNLNEYMAEFVPDMKLYGDTAMELVKEDKQYILNELAKMIPTEIDTVDNDFYYYSNRSEFINDISTIMYKNHRIYKFKYDLSENSDLYNYIIKLTNQVAIEGLREEEFDIEEIYVKKIFADNTAQDEDTYRYKRFYDEAYQSIIKFILENTDEVVDVNQDMYSIRIRDDDYGYVFFTTNKVEEFEKATARYYDSYNWYYDNEYYYYDRPKVTTTELVEVLEVPEKIVDTDSSELNESKDENDEIDNQNSEAEKLDVDNQEISGELVNVIVQ